jgi:predicted N-acyltransferase
MTEDEWRHMGDAGLLQRTDQQFHWENRNYACFDNFLAHLSSRKRKAIRKEREGARAHDIDIEIVTGSDLTSEHWDAFFHFYIDTSNRKWGQAYLNREFFGLLGESMADQVALIMCKRDGRYIAGALNMIGRDTLFGRNWGCIEDHRFLHFEVCYYQAIEFAIARGLQRVEAGAQGAHKLSRGYMPTATYSAHWVANLGLRDAINRYLTEERRMVDQDIDALARHTPFKRGPEG